MNIKKIGLTALAGSLVVTSAYAGSMSVSGGASIGVKNTSKTASGKSWTMGNQLTFSGSGELDNGMNVSLSFVLDQADDSTTGLANSPFDSHSVTISSDALGTLVFSGEGGSSAQSAIDTTAAGDLWNNGSNVTAPRASEAGNNSLYYTLPTFLDDLAVKVSMSPGGAGGSTATSWAIGYTGVEGLSVDYGTGETNTIGTEQDHTTMKASYAIGSFTVGLSSTENNYETAASIDEKVASWQVAYTISDDMSVTYGVDTITTEAQSVDEEISGLGISYTTGGVTITANKFEASGQGNSNTESSVTGDQERWTLGASFAF
jgi:outer membrane protein OmpU